jgi:hypothetical protein
MDLKDVYKTPRASVRGVFLFENVAAFVPVSVLTGGITQEAWDGSSPTTIGSSESSLEDIWINI